jgi:hypothetical protein
MCYSKMTRRFKTPVLLSLLLWFPIESLAMVVATPLCEHMGASEHRVQINITEPPCHTDQATGQGQKQTKDSFHTCERCSFCVLSCSFAIPTDFDSAPAKRTAPVSDLMRSAFSNFISEPPQRPPLHLV